MLSERLKDALIVENKEHGHCTHYNADHCYHLIVFGALLRSGEESLTREDHEEAINFVVSEIINSLILKGMIEVGSMSPEGDMTYIPTEAGEEAYRHATGGE